MLAEIKFGTDGWRSVIADGFTIQNVKRAAQAACDVVRKTSKSRLILVGYDRRFFSDRFADTAAKVAVANGFRVEISSAPMSSPMLSFQVKQRKAAIGFMITASHNPPTFNGFKLKGPHGGSVDEALTKAVEDRVDVSEIQWGDDAGKRVDFLPAYVAEVKKLFKGIDLKSLKGPVVFDAMHGPGGAIFEHLTPSMQKTMFIRRERDPLFGGVNPEPIEQNLGALKEAVLASRAAVGIAVDGDVDRVGIVDDKGRYLPPHTVMPLILLHLLEHRKLKGKVLQTVSLGYLSSRIARHFNLPFEELPVGFKHIAKKMGEGKVAFGGEESGGYGSGLWIPERDALVCALLILEMLAVRKLPLSAIVEDLFARFGRSVFRRVDFPLNGAIAKDAWSAHIAGHVGKTVAGYNVKNLHSFDGVKVITDDDSWILMRPSGTEPLIRTYSEGTSEKTVADLLKEAERLVKLPLPKPERRSDDQKAKKKKVRA